MITNICSLHGKYPNRTKTNIILADESLKIAWDMFKNKLSPKTIASTKIVASRDEFDKEIGLVLNRQEEISEAPPTPIHTEFQETGRHGRGEYAHGAPGVPRT